MTPPNSQRNTAAADPAGPPNPEHPQEHGIDQLLDRLKREGVEQGRADAAARRESAEADAARIIAEAEAKAAKHVADARAEAETIKRATEDALKVAARDAMLSLKDTLMHHFADDVRRLVADRMSDPAMLDTLISDVVARVAADLPKEPVTVLLPASVVNLDDLKAGGDFGADSPLATFAAARSRVILEGGVSLAFGSEGQAGLKLLLQDGQIEVDLSDERISAVLLAHLQPRFRAILEGLLS